MWNSIAKLYSIFANRPFEESCSSSPSGFSETSDRLITVHLPPQRLLNNPLISIVTHVKRGRERGVFNHHLLEWGTLSSYKKKTDRLINRSKEREKTQAAKYQTESRKGRREKKKKVKKEFSNTVGKLFFFPRVFELYKRDADTDRAPIFNLARCTHTHTHTRIHKRTVELVRRYSSMKIETRRANFLTRENYPRETSY